jgi:glycerol kinase
VRGLRSAGGLRREHALGAAFLAGLGTGVWASTDELRATWRLDRQFEPVAGVREDGSHARWLRAVERSSGWELSGR